MPWTKHSHYPSGRRWVNDVGRLRLSLSNLRRVMENYKSARDYGYNQALSVRFAIHVAESAWHSRGLTLENRKNGRPYAWQVGTRIDASKERFLKLVGNTLHSKITLRELDLSEPQELIFKHLESAGPRYYTDSILAAKRYKLIFGSQTELEEGRLIEEFTFCAGLRKQWLKTKRGKDLFFLWRFNIPQVIEQVRESALYSARTVWGVKTIWHQAYGRYLPNTPEAITYVRRWVDWWKENTARFDELRQVTAPAFEFVNGRWQNIPKEPIRQDLHPEILLRHEHERAEQRRREEEAWRAAYPYVRDTEYPWVQEVMHPIETCLGTLTPVSTLAELEACGAELHNCAASYWHEIQNKKTLLVYLQNGKKLALASYNSDGERLQLVGPCNKRPSKDVLEAFSSVSVSWEE